jgi:hypothetical protein
VSDAGSADYQAAIGDGLADTGELLGCGQQGRGSNRGAGLAERNVIGVHHAQPREAEVGHGAGSRADIQRVSRGHQHHAQIVFPAGFDTSIVSALHAQHEIALADHAANRGGKKARE